MGQRVKITPSNLKTWTMNLQTFLEKGLLKGNIPEKLEGCYIVFSDEGIRVREPSEIVLSTCPKCGGTGQYRHFGVCYDCKGRGSITFADEMRDSYYHELRRRSDDVKP